MLNWLSWQWEPPMWMSPQDLDSVRTHSLKSYHILFGSLFQEYIFSTFSLLGIKTYFLVEFYISALCVLSIKLGFVGTCFGT